MVGPSISTGARVVEGVRPEDRTVLRELAHLKAEAAADPANAERRRLWTALNMRRPLRPMVHIYQEPWNELDPAGELEPRIEDRVLRPIERGLRLELYKWRHHRADMIVEPVVHVPMAVTDTGHGITPEVDLLRDGPGAVASQRFHPLVKDEGDVAKIRDPVVTHDEAETARRVDAVSGAVGDILQVEPGRSANLPSAPWDFLVRLTGVTEILTDMAERPEYVHALIDRMTSAQLARLDQYDALGLHARNDTNVVVGQGGYGHTEELPAEGFDPSRVRTMDRWGGTMSQAFSAVSPAMHWEFALQYEIRWLERFGLCYYGCCEPLHDRLDIVRRIPRLRKVSMSPWANLARAAGETKGELVLSVKPSPAFLARDAWDPEAVRADLERLLAEAGGAPVELILKDISTVRREPRRLTEWARVAMEVAEEAAGRGA